MSAVALPGAVRRWGRPLSPRALVPRREEGRLCVGRRSSERVRGRATRGPAGAAGAVPTESYARLLTQPSRQRYEAVRVSMAQLALLERGNRANTST